LPEPKNNPQVGMANMRTIVPALQKAKAGSLLQNVRYVSVSPPKQQRQTRLVKDRSPDEIAAELAEWIAQG
jgi:electron transfer flavoprotein beta subunit